MEENVRKEAPEAQPAEDQSTPAQAGETGPAAEPESAGAVPERDFAGEVAELTRQFPEMGSGGRLPDEVVDAAVRQGKSVVEAYREYALGRAGQDAAVRAPVRGVSGGWPVGDQAKDAFLTGFDSEA